MLAIIAGIAVGLMVVIGGRDGANQWDRDVQGSDDGLRVVHLHVEGVGLPGSWPEPGGGSQPPAGAGKQATQGAPEDLSVKRRLVLPALAGDGTPEPGATAAATRETVAIPEPTVVPEPTPIAVDVDAIDRFLAGSPLAGMGSVFVAAAAMYGIDPRLMPAVSMHESGRCLHHEAASHNCWGLTTGQRTVEGHLVFRDFDSYEDAIWAVSRTYGGYGLPTYAALCMWVSGRANCDSDYPGKVIATMEGIR